MSYRKTPDEPQTPLQKAKAMKISTTKMLEMWHAEVKKNNLDDTYRHWILQTLLTEEAKWGNMWLKYEPGEKRDAFILAHQSMVEKLSDFSVRYKLKTKTLEATILLFDKVLTAPQMARYIKQPGSSNSAASSGDTKYSLTTIGMTLLFMQSKFEEIYPPSMSAFIKWCDHGVEATHISVLERILLLELGWNLLTATATDYLGWFFETLNVDKKSEYLTYLILECSFRAKFPDQIHGPANRKWDFFNKKKQKAFPSCDLMESYPSKLALGCLCLSLAYQGKICFPKELEMLVGMTSYDLGPLIKQLHEQLRTEVSNHLVKHCPTIKKFSMRRYQQIGAFKPPTWVEMVQHNAFRETQVVAATQVGRGDSSREVRE